MGDIERWRYRQTDRKRDIQRESSNAVIYRYPSIDICACDASDDGPYDNEGVISKLLCRKLLSCTRIRDLDGRQTDGRKRRVTGT